MVSAHSSVVMPSIIAAATCLAVSALITLAPGAWTRAVISAAPLLLAAALAARLLGLQWAAPESHDSCPVGTEQLLHIIRSRRSVFPKDFRDNGDGHAPPLPREELELMLEAARWAPTHKLTQPWHFVVLAGAAKAEFEELTLRCCEELLPPEKAAVTVAKLQRKRTNDWPKVAAYIAICLRRHEDDLPEWEETAAVACAVQNLWLTATAAGVGGYWSSWQAAARDAPAMSAFLGLGPGDKCLGVWLAGWPAEERVASYRPRRAPLESCVEWRIAT